eukprot:26023-Pelagococcus_subviridis.AAC.2
MSDERQRSRRHSGFNTRKQKQRRQQLSRTDTIQIQVAGGARPPARPPRAMRFAARSSPRSRRVRADQRVVGSFQRLGFFHLIEREQLRPDAASDDERAADPPYRAPPVAHEPPRERGAPQRLRGVH